MAACFPGDGWTFVPAATNRMSCSPNGGFSVGAFRLPTDALFSTTLTLQNVIGGSRFRVTRNDTGAELATGTVSGSTPTDHVISPINAYANPMLVKIVIRHASGSTKYKPFETFAYLYKTGSSAYILQQVD